MNTTDCLMIAGSIVPDRTSIVFEGKRFSFQQLQDRVNRLANAMADMGVGIGDRVATMQVNTNHLIETYFAAAKLDAIFVPLNFRSRVDELAFMIEESGPSVFFVGSRYADVVKSLPKTVLPDYLVSLDEKIDGEWPYYENILESSPPDELHFPEGGGPRYHYPNVYGWDYRRSKGGHAHPSELLLVPAGQRKSTRSRRG